MFFKIVHLFALFIGNAKGNAKRWTLGDAKNQKAVLVDFASSFLWEIS